MSFLFVSMLLCVRNWTLDWKTAFSVAPNFYFGQYDKIDNLSSPAPKNNF